MSNDLNSDPLVGAPRWLGDDIASRTGAVHTLTNAEVNEIEAAISASAQSPIAEIKQPAFALPTLSGSLADIRHELVDGRGYVLLRGLPVARWTREESVRAYWGLGLHIGQPVSQNPEGHLLGHVTDIGGDFHDLNSRGGYRSSARLPFHTDVGADVVGLLCLRAAKRGGFSSLVSIAAIHETMRARRPDLVEILSQPVYRDRRGEIPPGKKPYYRAPVFCRHEGRLTTTFVRRFIDSAPRHDGVPALTPELVEALDLFEATANDPTLRLDMDFQPGDLQFVNNLTVLHARTDYEDFEAPDRKRHLLRLWLALPEGWPLPDFYFDRFGTEPATGRPAGMAMPGVTPTVPLDVL